MTTPSAAALESCFDQAELSARGQGFAPCADWAPHPKFPGVRLKTLAPGAVTDGRLSCALVRIDPGCRLEAHAHDPQWELHEVVQGAGVAIIDGNELDYRPGKLAVIPAQTMHSVTASEQGLVLLAKFFPALA
jgi:quercetin dioxygenase-like cupin family protein